MAHDHGCIDITVIGPYIPRLVIEQIPLSSTILELKRIIHKEHPKGPSPPTQQLTCEGASMLSDDAQLHSVFSDAGASQHREVHLTYVHAERGETNRPSPSRQISYPPPQYSDSGPQDVTTATQVRTPQRRMLPVPKVMGMPSNTMQSGGQRRRKLPAYPSTTSTAVAGCAETRPADPPPYAVEEERSLKEQIQEILSEAGALSGVHHETTSYAQACEESGGQEAIIRFASFSQTLLNEVESRHRSPKQLKIFNSLKLDALKCMAEKKSKAFETFINEFLFELRSAGLIDDDDLSPGCELVQEEHPLCGKCCVAPMKSEVRSDEKIQKKYGGDVSQLTDFVRGTIPFKTIERMYKAAQILRDLIAKHNASTHAIVEFSDRFQTPTSSGYMDLQFVLQLDRFSCELQLTTAALKAAKSGAGGHNVYRWERYLAEQFMWAAIRNDMDEHLALIDCHHKLGQALSGTKFSTLLPPLIGSRSLTNQSADMNGYRALHFAAFHGNVEMAKSLVTFGAETTCITGGGELPVDIALAVENWQCAQVLLPEAPDVAEAGDAWGSMVAQKVQALLGAIIPRRGCPENLFESILRLSSDPNVAMIARQTLLHTLVSIGCSDGIHALFNNDEHQDDYCSVPELVLSSVNTKHIFTDETPLDVAAAVSTDWINIVRTLRAGGANLHTIAFQGDCGQQSADFFKTDKSFNSGTATKLVSKIRLEHGRRPVAPEEWQVAALSLSADDLQSCSTQKALRFYLRSNVNKTTNITFTHDKCKDKLSLASLVYFQEAVNTGVLTKLGPDKNMYFNIKSTAKLTSLLLQVMHNDETATILDLSRVWSDRALPSSDNGSALELDLAEIMQNKVNSNLKVFTFKPTWIPYAEDDYGDSDDDDDGDTGDDEQASLHNAVEALCYSISSFVGLEDLILVDNNLLNPAHMKTILIPMLQDLHHLKTIDLSLAPGREHEPGFKEAVADVLPLLVGNLTSSTNVAKVRLEPGQGKMHVEWVSGYALEVNGTDSLCAGAFFSKLPKKDEIITLDLTGNELGAPGIKILKTAGLISLKHLKLNRAVNVVQKATLFLKELLQILAKATLLEQLELDEIGMGADSMPSLQQVLEVLPRLKMLSLAGNKFTGASAQQLVPILVGIEDLERVDLGRADSKRRGELKVSLVNGRCLSLFGLTAQITCNLITSLPQPDDVRAIAAHNIFDKPLSSAKKMARIACDCYINDKSKGLVKLAMGTEVEVLPPNGGDIQNIKTHTGVETAIASTVLEMIPGEIPLHTDLHEAFILAIVRCQRLDLVDVSDNWLGDLNGPALEKLLSCCCGSIRSINFSNCGLGKTTLQHLIPTFKTLNNLRHLSISGNLSNFEDAEEEHKLWFQREFVPAVRSLKNLKTIDTTRGRLKGHVVTIFTGSLSKDLMHLKDMKSHSNFENCPQLRDAYKVCLASGAVTLAGDDASSAASANEEECLGLSSSDQPGNNDDAAATAADDVDEPWHVMFSKFDSALINSTTATGPIENACFFTNAENPYMIFVDLKGDELQVSEVKEYLLPLLRSCDTIEVLILRAESDWLDARSNRSFTTDLAMSLSSMKQLKVLCIDNFNLDGVATAIAFSTLRSLVELYVGHSRINLLNSIMPSLAGLTGLEVIVFEGIDKKEFKSLRAEVDLFISAESKLKIFSIQHPALFYGESKIDWIDGQQLLCSGVRPVTLLLALPKQESIESVRIRGQKIGQLARFLAVLCPKLQRLRQLSISCHDKEIHGSEFEFDSDSSDSDCGNYSEGNSTADTFIQNMLKAPLLATIDFQGQIIQMGPAVTLYQWQQAQPGRTATYEYPLGIVSSIARIIDNDPNATALDLSRTATFSGIFGISFCKNKGVSYVKHVQSSSICDVKPGDIVEHIAWADEDQNRIPTHRYINFPVPVLFDESSGPKIPVTRNLNDPMYDSNDSVRAGPVQFYAFDNPIYDHGKVLLPSSGSAQPPLRHGIAGDWDKIHPIDDLFMKYIDRNDDNNMYLSVLEGNVGSIGPTNIFWSNMAVKLRGEDDDAIYILTEWFPTLLSWKLTCKETGQHKFAKEPDLERVNIQHASPRVVPKLQKSTLAKGAYWKVANVSTSKLASAITHLHCNDASNDDQVQIHPLTRVFEGISNTFVEKICLTENQIEDPTSLFPILAQFKALTLLDLRGNDFSEAGVVSLADNIHKLRNLEEFYVSPPQRQTENYIKKKIESWNPEEGNVLLGALASMTSLRVADFGDRSGRGIRAISASGHSLQITSVHGMSSTRFFKCFSSCNAVQELDVKGQHTGLAAAVQLLEWQIADSSHRLQMDFPKKIAESMLKVKKHDSTVTAVNLSGLELGDEVASDLVKMMSDAGPSPHITCFDLRRNKLTAKSAPTLAKALHFFPIVDTLCLNQNSLHGEGLVNLQDGIARLSSLQRLELEANFINPHAISEFTQCLFDLSNLQFVGFGTTSGGLRIEWGDGRVLEIRGIHGDSLPYFVRAIRDQRSVHFLDVSGSMMDKTSVNQFGDALDFSDELRTLNLGANNLSHSSKELSALGPKLARCTALRDLDISGSRIGNGDLQWLTSAIRKLKSLESFNMSNVDLHLAEGGHVSDFYNHLAELSQMKVINLANNKLGPDGARALGAVLENFGSLEILNLAGNDFGNTGLERLAQPLQVLVALKELYLQDNAIKAAGCLLIAPAIGRLAALSLNVATLNNGTTNMLVVSWMNGRKLQIEGASKASIKILEYLPDLDGITQLDLTAAGIKEMNELEKLHDLLEEGRCLHLEKVTLDRNIIQRSGLEYLVSHFSPGVFKNVKILNLKRLGTNVDDFHAIAPLFQQLPVLEVVSLSVGKTKVTIGWVDAQSRQLEVEGVDPSLVPPFLKSSIQRGQIRSISVEECRVDSDIAEELANVLQNIPSLQSLQLLQHHLGPAGIANLSGALLLLPDLRELVLLAAPDDGSSNIAIGPDGAVSLARTISNLPLLENLNLQGNLLGHRGAVIVLTELQKCKHLKSLDFGLCKAGCGAALAISSCIKGLALLEDLSLFGNELGLEAIQTIVLAMSAQPQMKLRRLNLGWNGLSPADSKHLITLIPNLLHYSDLTNPWEWGPNGINRWLCQLGLHWAQRSFHAMGIFGVRLRRLSLPGDSFRELLGMKESWSMIPALKKFQNEDDDEVGVGKVRSTPYKTSTHKKYNLAATLAPAAVYAEAAGAAPAPAAVNISQIDEPPSQCEKDGARRLAEEIYGSYLGPDEAKEPFRKMFLEVLQNIQTDSRGRQPPPPPPRRGTLKATDYDVPFGLDTKNYTVINNEDIDAAIAKADAITGQRRIEKMMEVLLEIIVRQRPAESQQGKAALTEYDRERRRAIRIALEYLHEYATRPIATATATTDIQPLGEKKKGSVKMIHKGDTVHILDDSNHPKKWHILYGEHHVSVDGKRRNFAEICPLPTVSDTIFLKWDAVVRSLCDIPHPKGFMLRTTPNNMCSVESLTFDPGVGTSTFEVSSNTLVSCFIGLLGDSVPAEMVVDFVEKRVARQQHHTNSIGFCKVAQPPNSNIFLWARKEEPNSVHWYNFKYRIDDIMTVADLFTAVERGGHHDEVVPLKASPEILPDSIVLRGVFGRGNSGVVWKGTLQSDGGPIDVAVKQSNFHGHSTHENDLAMNKQLSHANIVRFFGTWAAGDGGLCIVMEVMQGGDLLSWLSKREHTFKPAHAVACLKATASALMYLESKKCVHRDIAARNVLVSADGSFKLGDFGIAIFLKSGTDVYDLQTFQSAPLWRAPEGANRIWSHKSDVWSFGVLMFECFTHGLRPYPGEIYATVARKLKCGYRLAQPPSCPSSIYSIMRKCWKWDHRDRPSANELYQNFQNYAIYAIPDLEQYLDGNSEGSIDFCNSESPANVATVSAAGPGAQVYSVGSATGDGIESVNDIYGPVPNKLTTKMETLPRPAFFKEARGSIAILPKKLNGWRLSHKTTSCWCELTDREPSVEEWASAVVDTAHDKEMFAAMHKVESESESESEEEKELSSDDGEDDYALPSDDDE